MHEEKQLYSTEFQIKAVYLNDDVGINLNLAWLKVFLIPQLT